MKIHIEAINEDAKRVTLIDGKLKFSFWKTKQSGEITKAYEQYQRYGFKSGQTVGAKVEEKAESFTNEAGKLINFTRRTILYFEEHDHLPVMEEAPNLYQQSKSIGGNELKQILRLVSEIHEKVMGSEDLVVPF